MKRHLAIFATAAALALPALVEAGSKTVISPDAMAAPAARGSVDAAALTDLLAEKGLITPQEQKDLTHPMGAPSVDEKALREYFRTAPYGNGSDIGNG